jgi:hypothetical protein
MAGRKAPRGPVRRGPGPACRLPTVTVLFTVSAVALSSRTGPCHRDPESVP